MKADWAAIKADYLATQRPYQELADRWGVSISSIKKKAAKEKWSSTAYQIVLESRCEIPAEPVEPSNEPAIELIEPATAAREMRIERARKMLRATDAMVDRVIDALEILKPGDTQSLHLLVRTLKDLREMQGLNKSALDIEEQQLRIELMRQQRQSMIAEPVVVEFVNTEDAEK